MKAAIVRARGVVKNYDPPGQPFSQLKKALVNGAGGEPWHRVLDKVDIDIFEGETVGLLGRNGVGKTTLLSILAGTMPATAGKVVRRGRIVPILELGGNFDLHRTGRANVVDFARSYDMPRAEIERVVETVRGFADIADYFDRPLRTYSSGMRSRLAFAAAMELEGDLIILDETLAVGDLSFRMKCYDAIRARQSKGTSFLLVSHNPDTLANLCSRIVIIEDAKIAFDGSPYEAVVLYKALRSEIEPRPGETHPVASVTTLGSRERSARRGELVEIDLRISAAEYVEMPGLNVGLLSEGGVAVCAISTLSGQPLPPIGPGRSGDVKVRFVNRLSAGEWRVIATLSDASVEPPKTLTFARDVLKLTSLSQTASSALADVSFELYSDRELS